MCDMPLVPTECVCSSESDSVVCVCVCAMRASQWDTAGNARFRTISSAYYRGAKVAGIMYDATNRVSDTVFCRMMLLGLP